MTTRRNFLRTGSLSLAGLVIGDKMLAASKLSAPAVEQAGSFTEHAKKVWSDYSTKRPAPSARKFTSEAVEKKLAEAKAHIKDQKLAWMFENCYPNTLDTTCEFKMKGGRPDLKADADGVLTGALFHQDKAVPLGLADGMKSLSECIENVFIRAEFNN